MAVNVVKTTTQLISAATTSQNVTHTPTFGDVLLGWFVTKDNVSPGQTVTIPTGWTQIGSTLHSYGAGVAALAYHVVTAAEGGVAQTYTWAWTTSYAQGGIEIVEYSGVDTTNPIDTGAGASAF